MTDENINPNADGGHTVMYGICENKCMVPVSPKTDTDAVKDRVGVMEPKVSDLENAKIVSISADVDGSNLVITLIADDSSEITDTVTLPISSKTPIIRLKNYNGSIPLQIGCKYSADGTTWTDVTENGLMTVSDFTGYVKFNTVVSGSGHTSLYGFASPTKKLISEEISEPTSTSYNYSSVGIKDKVFVKNDAGNYTYLNIIVYDYNEVKTQSTKTMSSSLKDLIVVGNKAYGPNFTIDYELNTTSSVFGASAWFAVDGKLYYRVQYNGYNDSFYFVQIYDTVTGVKTNTNIQLNPTATSLCTFSVGKYGCFYTCSTLSKATTQYLATLDTETLVYTSNSFMTSNLIGGNYGSNYGKMPVLMFDDCTIFGNGLTDTGYSSKAPVRSSYMVRIDENLVSTKVSNSSVYYAHYRGRVSNGKTGALVGGASYSGNNTTISGAYSAIEIYDSTGVRTTPVSLSKGVYDVSCSQCLDKLFLVGGMYMSSSTATVYNYVQVISFNDKVARLIVPLTEFTDYQIDGVESIAIKDQMLIIDKEYTTDPDFNYVFKYENGNVLSN